RASPSDGTAAVSRAWADPPAMVAADRDVALDTDVAGPVYERSGTEHVITGTNGETLLRIDSSASPDDIDSQ
ncbi:MAG: hypothetical protein ABEI98_06990, partial [Halorhabdus sp.]